MAIFLLISFGSRAQNPGLVISEVFVNPAGTDSCKEYLEVKVTKFIDFSLTPYSVIVCNNGTASSNGWIAGGGLTYAFAITGGTVNPGDVVYVGGACMAPTGIKIRAINVSTTGGDNGIGNNNNSGVFGNGGSNADGVAIFNVPLASITNTTVPVDALFYGTAVGSASLSASAGYQLPVSDLYSGGKLLGSSFITADPGPDISPPPVYTIPPPTHGPRRAAFPLPRLLRSPAPRRCRLLPRPLHPLCSAYTLPLRTK